ncbi:ABC transporter ATP-binding protein [Methanobrevibacter sp.]|uniref:ABC transporter ATP-binding protein n=1 Tax=Methanobrevibacter sp. TaxID=66852 RepID=UPI0025FDBF73|nr:ABC transporter ATP-binding protein [Methanobrevibacter sp.]MBQ6512835.1 ABC transporter ATP-binding protein [Methanobrevibacter sp.]
MTSNGEKMGLRGIVKNILRLMKDHELKFLLTGICAILSVLFTVISPLLLGDAINILIEGAKNTINHTGTLDFEGLIKLLSIAATLYFISNVVSYLQTYYLVKTTSDIIYSLRQRIINKAMQMPMESVDEKQRGYVLSRIIGSVNVLENALISSFTEITTTVITIIGTLIMMIATNALLTLAIVGVVLLSSALIAIISKISQKYFTLYSKGGIYNQIEEIFSHHEIIRTLNYENHTISEFNDNVDEWYSDEWKSRFLSSLNTPLTNLNSNLGYVTVAVLGSIFVLQGSMTIGRILSFFEFLKNFTDPIKTLTDIMPKLQAGAASAERIFEFLEMEDEENPSTKELESLENEITFDNISFGYTEDEKIIDNFSLTVKKGEKIAIIGEKGSGKTTIIKLLTRLYDVDSGEIKIDGTNINEYDKHSLRSLMGMVLQEIWLFSDTIEENIRYGNLEATENEIIAASKKANADKFIRQLPEGYNTILNEDGDNISQGQRQLLTIARAIISNKEILILDEATSNVDTRTELLIQEALDELMKNKTSFIVAHRLSTIRNADKIVVLGKGRVIEQGTHEELLAKKGYYYNTLKTQRNI